jgi:hypothetical protein
MEITHFRKVKEKTLIIIINNNGMYSTSVRGYSLIDVKLFGPK